jgi:hypothetical protein
MHVEQAKKTRYAFSDSHGLFPHPIQNELSSLPALSAP